MLWAWQHLHDEPLLHLPVQHLPRGLLHRPNMEKQRMPVSPRYTLPSQTFNLSHPNAPDPELNEIIDPLTQHFSYANNVTICDDGTVCPNPNNQTCCTKHQGRTELNYQNPARLPESVTGLASYYSQAGYTIPGSSATASVKLHAAQSSSVPTSATQSSTSSSSTPTQPSAAATSSHTSAKQTLSPAPSSSGLSTGAKAGIGVGVAVAAMICATAAFIFWIRRRKTTDNGPVGGSHNGGGWPWQGREGPQGAAPAYFSPELGTDSAKFEVDGATATRPSVPQELASEGVQKHN